jgi:predicted dehydrogenase
MEKTKIGVIGCGYWGPNLIRNFDEIQESNVVAVADLSDARLSYIKINYPQIQVTKNYHDFKEYGVEAAVVSTPPSTHYAIARGCLEDGQHVLVEKPLTLNSTDAQNLIDLAESKDLTLMVGHTFEYNAAVLYLKRIIQNGEIGDIYYVDTARLNLGLFQPGSNVLWDLAPHDISILLYLLDLDPISVSAHGNPHVFKGIFDVAFIHLKFPHQISAYVHVSWLDPRKVRRVTVVGSKKMVVYNDIESLEKVKIYDKGVERPEYTDTFGEFECCYRYGDLVIPNILFVEPLKIECQHFLHSICNHTKPNTDGKVGKKVVQVLEAAERSLLNSSTQEEIIW